MPFVFGPNENLFAEVAQPRLQQMQGQRICRLNGVERVVGTFPINETQSNRQDFFFIRRSKVEFVQISQGVVAGVSPFPPLVRIDGKWLNRLKLFHHKVIAVGQQCLVFRAERRV
jgi:hypothetical protein